MYVCTKTIVGKLLQHTFSTDSGSSSQSKSPQQIIPTYSIPSGDSQQLQQSSLAPSYQLNLEVYLWNAKSIVNKLNDFKKLCLHFKGNH